jgi:hypothetical protein
MKGGLGKIPQVMGSFMRVYLFFFFQDPFFPQFRQDGFTSHDKYPKYRVGVWGFPHRLITIR